jgi:hypothetical protein
MSRLQNGGPISASDINIELRRPWNAPFNLHDRLTWFLAGDKPGQINFSDFWGKQRFVDRGTYLAGYCAGYERIDIYADGEGGQYTVQTPNAAVCGYVPPPPPPTYPPYGTVLEQYCIFGALTTVVADGRGGSYTTQENGSPVCQSGDWGGA